MYWSMFQTALQYITSSIIWLRHEIREVKGKPLRTASLFNWSGYFWKKLALFITIFGHTDVRDVRKILIKCLKHVNFLELLRQRRLRKRRSI